MYRILFVFLDIISRTPFVVLYFIADGIYLLVFHVVGYRKKVVYQNLRNSFPEKTEAEIEAIAREFYKYFADMIVETIKWGSMTAAEADQRMVVKNPEFINKYYDQGKSVLVYATHYGNVDWQGNMTSVLSHTFLAIYQKLSNPYFDDLIKKHRERFGCVCIEMSNSYKTIYAMAKDGELTGSWMASDQAPQSYNKFWTMFLNQETSFFVGVEKIAKKTNQVVLFQELTRVKRGHYEVEFSLVCEDPASTKEYEITQKYVELLDAQIRKSPAYWLWSHRRWKRSRPEGMDLHIPEGKL
jgi:KDO2-lipid IV(A) lauroyltransferase